MWVSLNCELFCGHGVLPPGGGAAFKTAAERGRGSYYIPFSTNIMLLRSRHGQKRQTTNDKQRTINRLLLPSVRRQAGFSNCCWTRTEIGSISFFYQYYAPPEQDLIANTEHRTRNNWTHLHPFTRPRTGYGGQSKQRTTYSRTIKPLNRYPANLWTDNWQSANRPFDKLRASNRLTSYCSIPSGGRPAFQTAVESGRRLVLSPFSTNIMLLRSRHGQKQRTTNHEQQNTPPSLSLPHPRGKWQRVRVVGGNAEGGNHEPTNNEPQTHEPSNPLVYSCYYHCLVYIYVDLLCVHQSRFCKNFMPVKWLLYETFFVTLVAWTYLHNILFDYLDDPLN